jgi:hypothetical protein
VWEVHESDPSAFGGITRHEGLEDARLALLADGWSARWSPCSEPPPHMPAWTVYVPEFFEYMFISRTAVTLLIALKI